MLGPPDFGHGPVAQLVRALRLHRRSRRFEPGRAHSRRRAFHGLCVANRMPNAAIRVPAIRSIHREAPSLVNHLRACSVAMTVTANQRMQVATWTPSRSQCIANGGTRQYLHTEGHHGGSASPGEGLVGGLGCSEDRRCADGRSRAQNGPKAMPAPVMWLCQT